jgi:hypothetical protein
MPRNAEIEIRVLRKALGGISEEPRSLARQLKFYSEELRSDLTVATLVDEVCSGDKNNPFKLEFHRALIHWDHLTDQDWAKKASPNSEERRALIYELLEVSDNDAKRFDEAVPFCPSEHATIIAAKHTRWYDENRQNETPFYWPAYVRYLRGKSWGDEALESLSESTRQVIERLADPRQAAAFQSKGLVVGYVQSGKTANFTGVVARAADAGYRLFIVLTGQTELLRKQTQRRLDKEMIGRELVDNDYVKEPDFDQFISHQQRPSKLGSFDWQRLTGLEYDYQSLKRGIDVLEFERINRAVPFYDAANLRPAKARLIVIKKNDAILKKVIHDLGEIKAKIRLDQIPAIIIDDESDQASVNTKAHSGKRSTINAHIVNLLGILPRAQYIGYTATPFANVFIDPGSAEDLFPKDFLVGLPRPPEYMGVADFYDLDDRPASDPKSNRRAFVRDVIGEDSDNLQRALDSFVLTGALKIFRKQKGVVVRSNHHTMLVHRTPSKAAHRAQVDAIDKLLTGSDYRSGPALKRLKELYETDFAPVTAERAPKMPVPRTFTDLGPAIADCLSRLYAGGKAVLMVNSEDDAESPDFDRGSVWKILVGGTKLSRGYTVEGLTISYYRRAAKSADTLMQMGRWFGFREGYRDLVRLFVGTQEPAGRNETIDLYEAFGAICRDEEGFRKELKRYASMEEPRILPIQVPPLVPSHMLLPTSRNKMFNAKVQFQNYGRDSSESTLAPTETSAIKSNSSGFAELIKGASLTKKSISFDVGAQSFSYEVLAGELDKKRVHDFLAAYKWSEGRKPLQRVIEFLDGKGEADAGIDRWLLVAPLQASAGKGVKIGGYEFSVFRRSRVEGGRISVFSEPRHKLLAEYASLGTRSDADKDAIKKPSKAMQGLYQKRQATLLYYTVKTTETDKNPFPGFMLQFPENSIQTLIRFGVQDPQNKNAVVVSSN